MLKLVAIGVDYQIETGVGGVYPNQNLDRDNKCNWSICPKSDKCPGGRILMRRCGKYSSCS